MSEAFKNHIFDKFDFSEELSLLTGPSNITIKPLIKEDKTHVIEALRDSLKALHMWLPWADNMPSYNDSVQIGEQFFKESASLEAIHYTVYQNEILMGMCNLSNYDKESSSARLGYWFRSTSDDMSPFIEATQSIIRYAFENSSIRQLFIPCMVGNFVGESVAKSLNFTLLTIELVHNKQIKVFKIDKHTFSPKHKPASLNDNQIGYANI